MFGESLALLRQTPTPDKLTLDRENANDAAVTAQLSVYNPMKGMKLSKTQTNYHRKEGSILEQLIICAGQRCSWIQQEDKGQRGIEMMEQ